MCEKSSKFSNHSATSDFLFQKKQGSKNDTGRILKFRREVQWVVVTPSSCVFLGVVFRISTYLFLLRPFYMSKNLGRKRNRFVRFLDINWLCNHIHPGSKKMLVFKFHTHLESPVDLLWFMMMYFLLTKWQRWQFLPVFSCDTTLDLANAGCASPEIHGFCQNSRLNKQGLHKAVGVDRRKKHT